jgi:hypothetical protein
MQWFQFATRLFPFIVGAVHGVELLAGTRAGHEKQSAAVEMVKAMIMSGDVGAGAEVLDDPLVEDAIRKSIDAYVAVHNAVAANIARGTPATPAIAN